MITFESPVLKTRSLKKFRKWFSLTWVATPTKFGVHFVSTRVGFRDTAPPIMVPKVINAAARTAHVLVHGIVEDHIGCNLDHEQSDDEVHYAQKYEYQ